MLLLEAQSTVHMHLTVLWDIHFYIPDIAGILRESIIHSLLANQINRDKHGFKRLAWRTKIVATDLFDCQEEEVILMRQFMVVLNHVCLLIPL